MKLITNLNHQLARLDTLEHTRGPVRRWLLPLTALGLTGTILVKNQQEGGSQQTKTQVLKRDGLIIGGMLTGLFLGNAFSRSVGRALVRKLGKAATHEHSHGVHEVASKFKTPLGQWLGQRYNPEKHSHALQGFIALESLALGSILGGGLGGVLADRLNQRDIRQSAPMKLKEGIFQFVGNITVCTVAIVTGSALGGRFFRQLGKIGILERFNTARLLKTVTKQGQATTPSLKQLPTQVTGRLEANPSPEHLAELAHDVLGHAEASAFERFLTKQDSSQAKPFKAAISTYFLDRIHPQYQAVAKAGSFEALPQGLQADLRAVAQQRFEKRGEWLGTILGLVGGVLGGAWSANHLNQWLSKQFHLPAGHADVHLFSPPKPGALAGKVGDRGLHWWDVLTHVDDIPGALYIGGMHLFEPIIWLLYGLSGYLTGTAGSDYAQQDRPPVARGYNPFSQPLPPVPRISYIAPSV